MSILRRVMIEERNRLEGKPKRNEAVYQRFFSVFPDEKRVFIYVNFGSEVETLPIIRRLLAEGKSVYAPKMINRDMHFYDITDPEALVKSAVGIPEPKGDTEEVFPEEEDLMIIPGVMFDEYGGRIGYGMGCYDRYLAAHDCRKCAIAFEMQIQSEPMTLKSSDIRFDCLLTERRFLEKPLCR